MKKSPFLYSRAICYSGFRQGQSPGINYPTDEQVLEDLLILQGNWRYLRMYDVDPHTESVLRLIKEHNLDFQVMLGSYIIAEMNNYGCPWGGVYPEDQLRINKDYNNRRTAKLVALANEYSDFVCAVSVGNEACVDWTDHYVSIERVMEFAQTIKSESDALVTFCENYVPWLNKLKPLAEVLDFISIHTYPVWEYKNIHEALGYTKDNYYSVANLYPDKPTIITEAGWATNSNGRGIESHNVNEELQQHYIKDLLGWTDNEEILCFVFEAFDEPWKGSNEPMEPEKHWGLYFEDRSPKKIMQDFQVQKLHD